MNNLTGKRFGRLTVIKAETERLRKSIVWNSVCDCGNFKKIMGTEMIRGHTKSCGCLHKDFLRKTIHEGVNLKHGDDRHNGKRKRIYRIWTGMKSRCFNPRTNNFKYYGGKGISVCSEWKNNYLIFKRWSMLHGYKDNLVIDRIKNDGDYEPGNCHWITGSENTIKTNTNRKRREPCQLKLELGEENFA